MAGVERTSTSGTTGNHQIGHEGGLRVDPVSESAHWPGILYSITIGTYPLSCHANRYMELSAVSGLLQCALLRQMPKQ